MFDVGVHLNVFSLIMVYYKGHNMLLH